MILPVSEICKRIRKMRGIPPKSIKILCDEVQPTLTYSTPRDIADILAKTFASVSSNDNYIPSFLPRKRLIEQNLPDFGNMNCSYNKKFEMRELECILAKINNITPGEDGVTYGMIKNMPVKAKEFLLRVFNRFFRESYFPPIWNRSTVIPIPKHGKNPNSPKSYRPISLTSCLCKLIVWEPRDQITAYFNTVRQIAKFGMIVYHKIVINNLI